MKFFIAFLLCFRFLGLFAQDVQRIDTLALSAMLANKWDSLPIYLAQGRTAMLALSEAERVQWSARWDFFEAARLINAERDFAPAIEQLTTVLQRQQGAVHIPMHRAQSLRQMGVAHYYLGELEMAAKYWEEAQVILRQDTEGEKGFQYRSGLNNLGLVYYNLNEYEKSEAEFVHLYALMHAAADTSSLLYAQVLNNMGNMYRKTGDLSTAELMFREALALRKQLAKGVKDLGYLRVLNNLALLYSSTSRRSLAIETLREVLAVQEANNFLVLEEYASILDNLGALYQENDEYAKALPIQKKALELRKKALPAGHQDIVLSMLNVGSCMVMLKQYDEGMRYLQEVWRYRVDNFGQTSESALSALIYLIGGYRTMGDYEQALAHINLSIKNNTNIDINGALTAETAARILQSDAASADLLNDALVNLYLISLAQNNTAQAQEIIELRLALVDKQREKIQGAASNRKQLSQLTNDITVVFLSDLSPSADIAFSLIERTKATFLLEAAATSSAQRMGALPDSLSKREQAMEKRQSELEALISEASDQKTIDSLRGQLVSLNIEAKQFQKQLEQSYPQYAQLKNNTRRLSSADVQKMLGSDRAFLNYFEGYQCSWVVYTDANGSQVVKIPLPFDALNAKSDSLHSLLSGYELLRNQPDKAYKAYTALAHWFYVELMKPVLQDKPHIQQLFISADGSLANLPFEAFLMEMPASDATGNYADLAYLVRRYAVSYQYSAAMWALSKETKRQAHNEKALFVAANYALPIEARTAQFRNPQHSLVRRALAPLHAAVEEATVLANAFKGDLLLDAQANERAFKLKASEYGIIHLAMHGLLDENAPHLSCLAFSEDNDTAENNFLQAYEISKMQLRAELVVLSACETGKGKFEQGNGTASLARAFLYAGVPALVVSLWEVNDGTTATLMQLFYANLYSGMDKARALQKAKIEFLAQAKGIAAHPAFWSAFVQVGDESPISMRKNNARYGWYIAAGAVLLSAVALGAYFLRRRVA